MTTGAAVRRRFEMALRAGGMGTWRWDLRTDVIDWDGAMEGLYGFEPGTFDGSYETYRARVHPDDREDVAALVADTLRERRPVYHFEHRVLRPGGGVRWVSATGQLSLDDTGEPAELIGVTVDVTARREAELERTAALAAEDRARAAVTRGQRRMRMLAQASRLLDTPLDLDATLQDIAELAVNEIAEWCVVDLVGGATVHRAAVAHREPAMVALARRLQERYPSDMRSPVNLQLLTTLEPVFMERVPPQMIQQAARDEEHRAMLTSLDLTSYLAVPLVAEGKAVGTMAMATTGGRLLTQADVDLAMELGRRAGATVDKTRLYEELQRTARTLQSSLLPPVLPTIPGVTLSAHYRSGTRGIDIGGDYYDVFRTSAERWWVVLGDVCGKGPGAAALAAAVRYTLRAIAPDTDDPAVLVRRLNDVLLAGEWGERFTTLVLATFVICPLSSRGCQDGDHGPHGEASPSDDQVLRLSLVSGGHPPALLRHADGTVEAVSAVGSLVGVLNDVALDVVQLDLLPGDTLLLYTDGATEARDQEGSELGQGNLVEVLAHTGAGDRRDQVADRLAEALASRASGGFSDDLALLTLSR